jgi:hypothetical protein
VVLTEPTLLPIARRRNPTAGGRFYANWRKVIYSTVKQVSDSSGRFSPGPQARKIGRILLQNRLPAINLRLNEPRIVLLVPERAPPDVVEFVIEIHRIKPA